MELKKLLEGVEVKKITGETLKEIEGIAYWSWGGVKSGKMDWLQQRKINLLFQTASVPHPEIPDVPPVITLAKTDQQREALDTARSDARKSQVGSGDRSERIRTYNFPQGRITDHRINLTLYKIAAIMDGDLDELTGALSAEHQAEQLAALGEEAA